MIIMDESFAQRLAAAMDIRNVKQSELVEKTGITKGAISSYVSGEYVPKQTNTYKLAQALDVNPTWLMGYDVPMDKNVNVFGALNDSDIKALEKRYGKNIVEKVIDIDGNKIILHKNNTEFDRLRGELLLSHYETINPTGQDAIIKMIYFLKQLNTLGQNEAIKRVEELTYIDKYKTETPDYLQPIAAHLDGELTDEIKDFIDKF